MDVIYKNMKVRVSLQFFDLRNWKENFKLEVVRLQMLYISARIDEMNYKAYVAMTGQIQLTFL